MACAEKIHFRSHLFPTEEKKEALAATLLHKSLEDEERRKRGALLTLRTVAGFGGFKGYLGYAPFSSLKGYV